MQISISSQVSHKKNRLNFKAEKIFTAIFLSKENHESNKLHCNTRFRVCRIMLEK